MSPKRIAAHIAVQEKKALPISTDFIRLDAALKLGNAVSTGGQAKLVIASGDVRVNGEACTQRGRKLHPGDRFCFGRTEYRVEKRADAENTAQKAKG